MEIFFLILYILWELFEIVCVIFTVSAFMAGTRKAIESYKKAQEKAEKEGRPIEEVMQEMHDEEDAEYENVQTKEEHEEVPDKLKGFVQQVKIESVEGRWMMYNADNDAYIAQGKDYNDLWVNAEQRFPDTTFIHLEITPQ